MTIYGHDHHEHTFNTDKNTITIIMQYHTIQDKTKQKGEKEQQQEKEKKKNERNQRGEGEEEKSLGKKTV